MKFIRTIALLTLTLSSAALAAGNNPRILVLIPETVIRHTVPDPAAETAVANGLLEAGMILVDLKQSEKLEGREAVMGWLEGRNDRNTLARLASRFKADLLVTGEAFAEQITNMPPELRAAGFSSFGSRLEIKVVDLATARILYSNAFTASGANLAPAIAAKTALQSAGEDAVVKLAPFMQKWKGGNGITAPARAYVVRVVGIPSYSSYKSFLEKMRNQKGISGVDARQYDIKDSEFEVNFGGSIDDLASKLERVGLKVMKLSAGEIRASYRK
jgi:hypothetical protein